MKSKLTLTLVFVSCILFFSLLTICTFAGNTRNAKKTANINTDLSIVMEEHQLAEIVAESGVYYFPLENVSSFENVNKDLTNFISTNNLLLIRKNNYSYYFKLEKGGAYDFSFALKDNSVEMFDGFVSDEIIKVRINSQEFDFSIFNNRPVLLFEPQ
jgi:hypothetical protein